MTTETQDLAVTRSVVVNAARERAFAVFTDRFFDWWPKGHHIGDADMAAAIIEPREGGRWYERGEDGVECEWGRVLAWEPPERLVLSWHLQGDWNYDPDPAKASEIEVRFVAETPNQTRVELVHRRIERHDNPSAVAEGVSSPGGWGGILAALADLVAA